MQTRETSHMSGAQGMKVIALASHAHILRMGILVYGYRIGHACGLFTHVMLSLVCASKFYRLAHRHDSTKQDRGNTRVVGVMCVTHTYSTATHTAVHEDHVGRTDRRSASTNLAAFDKKKLLLTADRQCSSTTSGSSIQPNTTTAAYNNSIQQ